MQRLAIIAPPQVHEIWALLSQIPDPEIPVLTITDLGMVRNVTQMGEGWVIGFTPTYSGCPATEHLIGAIREAMTTHGFTPVQGLFLIKLRGTSSGIPLLHRTVG